MGLTGDQFRKLNNNLVGFILNVIFLVTIISICVALNRYFYSMHAGFFDSLAYYNKAHSIQSIQQNEGVWAALKNASEQSTVFFPWLIAIFLNGYFYHDRVIGIVIQAPLLILLFFTTYRLFREVRNFSPIRSSLFALPLVSFPAIYHFNGGLADFRMDLLQALAFGSLIAQICIARHKRQAVEWGMVGVVAGIGFLVRATTPVYVVPLMGIMFVADVLAGDRVRTLRNYLLSGLIAALISMWFFLKNFDYLYYYYFVWNTDANAKLPIKESLQHVVFVFSDVGTILLLALLFCFVVSIIVQRREEPFSFGKINWVALLGAVIPLAYLVSSGAGLNPFVSLVAVPGLMLFLLCPFVDPLKASQSFVWQRMPVVLLVATLISSYIAIISFSAGISSWVPTKKGVSQIAKMLISYSRENSGKEIRVSVLDVGSLSNQNLENTLNFEEHGRPAGGASVIGTNYSIAFKEFGFGADSEWLKLEGETDIEKANSVIDDAWQTLDYVIIADEGSDIPMWPKANHFLSEFRSRLADGSRFKIIQSGIEITKTEKISIYKVLK